jgi:hypothetical protein
MRQAAHPSAGDTRCISSLISGLSIKNLCTANLRECTPIFFALMSTHRFCNTALRRQQQRNLPSFNIPCRQQKSKLENFDLENFDFAEDLHLAAYFHKLKTMDLK